MVSIVKPFSFLTFTICDWSLSLQLSIIANHEHLVGLSALEDTYWDAVIQIPYFCVTALQSIPSLSFPLPGKALSSPPPPLVQPGLTVPQRLGGLCHSVWVWAAPPGTLTALVFVLCPSPLPPEIPSHTEPPYITDISALLHFSLSWIQHLFLSATGLPPALVAGFPLLGVLLIQKYFMFFSGSHRFTSYLISKQFLQEIPHKASAW